MPGSEVCLWKAVRPTPDTAAAVGALRSFYAEHDVHVLGRFGEWAYINSDEAVHRGWQLADSLCGRRLTPLTTGGGETP